MKIRSKIALLLANLICVHSGAAAKNLKPKIDNDTYYHMGYVMNLFMAQKGCELGAKYQMKLVCTGGGLIDGINLMDLKFQLYGPPFTEMEARQLIVNCVDDYLQLVNQDETLRPFLRDYPFTPQNLDIDVFFHDPITRIMRVDPAMGSVSNWEGKIAYLTDDPADRFKYKSKKYESYDEAVAILKQLKAPATLPISPPTPAP